MKIYQIHEYSGSWEDKQDYIVFSYLDPVKAQIKKEELEAQELIDKMCDRCPLDHCYENCDNDCKNCTDEIKITRAKKYCSRCDIEKLKYEDGSSYMECKNNSGHYDDNSFEIKEVEVIE